MTNKLKSIFTSLAVGGTLALGAAFSASAHVPPEGSDQNKLLKNHEEFIMKMETKTGGSCCSLNDGRGDLEEKVLKDGRIQVMITHDLAGNKLPAPKPIIIPESAILSASHAKAVCDKVNAGKTPAEKAASTCTAPAFNVIWYRDDGHVYCYYPRPQFTN